MAPGRRTGNEQLIRAALTAAETMRSGADAIRLVEANDLPKNTSSGARTHLLSIADRLDLASHALGRAADSADPEPSFLRRLAWAGPAAAIGLAAVTGTMEGVAGEVVQRMVVIEQSVGQACDAVMGAEGAGSVAPARILLLPDQETITVFAKTDIAIPDPDGGDPLTVTVRPEPSGGVWVEVDGNYSEDAPTIAPLREKPLTARTRQGEPFIVHSPDGDPARLSYAYAQPELLLAESAQVSFDEKEAIGRFGFIVLD